MSFSLKSHVSTKEVILFEQSLQLFFNRHQYKEEDQVMFFVSFYSTSPPTLRKTALKDIQTDGQQSDPKN